MIKSAKKLTFKKLTLKQALQLTLLALAAGHTAFTIADSHHKNTNQNSSDFSFPTTKFEQASPDALGWDNDSLNAAIEFAKNNRSSALVISQNGRLVVERVLDR